MRIRTLAVVMAALAFACPALAQEADEPDAKPGVIAPPPAASELEPNLGWLNTDRPLRLSSELKGHVVVLDFWTYCCINCMHILPDLAKLEAKYKDDPVVVVGVHSAKFDNESDREAIRRAVGRYAIHHPVVVDKSFAIWRKYGARGWPTFVVIGADGKLVPLTTRFGPDYRTGGEGNLATLDEGIRKALDAGKASGTLARTVFRPKLDAIVPGPGSLAFPGKVLAVPPGEGTRGMLLISDSTHNRVVRTSYPDQAGTCTVAAVYGSGEAAMEDGEATAARLQDPQGLAYDPALRTIYVADTKNHAIRSIDVPSGKVSTLVGNGTQSRDREGGRAGKEQGLNSPWDLALTPDGQTLYVAMAGPHQLWKVDVAFGVAKAIAGGNGEDLLDATAPAALLAQPSGVSIAADGSRLYFADSEVSAVRYLDLKSARVKTVVGTGLFDFGDEDGKYPQARLQHPLGVAVWKAPDGPERLLVADTYNHKIKLVDPGERTSAAWIGVGRPGTDTKPGDLVLDEPGGLSVVRDEAGDWVFIADTNHHRVVRVNAATKAWCEVRINGLK